MLAQAARQNAAEVLLRGAVRWAVVVRQVEMSDAEVERRWTIWRWTAIGRSAPKFCQRPSEIAGSFSPLRPHRRYCMRWYLERSIVPPCRFVSRDAESWRVSSPALLDTASSAYLGRAEVQSLPPRAQTMSTTP